MDVLDLVGLRDGKHKAGRWQGDTSKLLPGRCEVALASGPSKPPKSPSPDASHHLQHSTPSLSSPTELDAAERRLHRHLLPIFIVLVTVSYLDRANLAFAAMQMISDLGFSGTIYGLGSGLFFLSYGICQIPANILLMRLGAPTWLALIAVVWGTCAGCFAFVRGPRSFLALRFLLGACEAGAMPGMWYYMSQFYPPDRLTLPYTVVEIGVTFSQILGAPLAAALLQLDGALGLRGWQWLFVVEALPALLLGGYLRWALPPSVAHASFLTSPQKHALLRAAHGASLGGSAASLRGSSNAVDATDDDGDAVDCERLRIIGAAACHAPSAAPATQDAATTFRLVLQAASSVLVLYPGVWRIFQGMAGTFIIFWAVALVNTLLPQGQAVADGSSETAAARPAAASTAALPVLLTAIPFACAAVASLAIAHRSQSTGERRLHIVVPWVAGALALLLLPAATSYSHGLAFVLLCIAHSGINGPSGCQTSWVTSLLYGPNRAVGVALYNSLGSLGAFIGPIIVGVLYDATGNYTSGMIVMAVSLLAASAMVYSFEHVLQRRKLRYSALPTDT